MATPAEHLYESCTCDGGMRDGARCADCGGRGIVSKGTKITGQSVESDEAEAALEGDLDNLSMIDLRERARNAGVSAAGGRAALIERIRAAAPAESDGDGEDGDGDGTETTDGDGDDAQDGDGEAN